MIVTAPAGTLALFARTDPRRLGDHLRLSRDETIALVRRELWSSWIIALAFGIPVLVLVNNLRVYRDDDGPMRWLLPFWVLLLLIAVSAGGAACSLQAVHRLPVGTAICQGLILSVARLPTVLPVVIVLWVIAALGGVLVTPALMFVPALIAVTFNHLVYDALGSPVADALDPTSERLGEEQRESGGKYSVG